MIRNIRLNENELSRIVRRVLIEQSKEPLRSFEDCQDKMTNLVKIVGKSKIPSGCFSPDNEQECLDSLEPLYDEAYNNLDYSRVKSRPYKKNAEIITAIVELNLCYSENNNSSDGLFDF